MRKYLLLLTLVALAGCAAPQSDPDTHRAMPQGGGGDAAFKTVHDRYVVEFLRRNPTVNTYLGGAGLDPSLREADGRLRDHSPAALAEEDRWLAETQKAFEGVDAQALSPARRIDREVALAQIRFLLHQHQERRYQERAVDTYVSEPFRAIDWQLQGMTETGPRGYGTFEEWTLVTKRVADIPRFLSAAQQQLEAGARSGNTADHRMLRRDGINTSEANAKYFEEELPKLAEERLALGEASGQLHAGLRDASRQAADAYRRFGEFVKLTFFDSAPGRDPQPKPQFAADRYALGEAEYNWALKNNLRLDTTAGRLYEEAWPVVQATREEMVALARRVLASEGVDDGELGLHLVRPDEIRALKRDHLGLDEETDALAFPIDARDDLPAGLPRQLGDVVICPAVVGDAWRRPLVHAVLHLLGYDHGPAMQAREHVHLAR